MAMMWRIHHPGLYRMKYFSMLPPQQVPKSIDKGDSDEMDDPPSRL
jgi:hypothetical protein